MSGYAAAAASLPVENWGALKWVSGQQKPGEDGESGAAAAVVMNGSAKCDAGETVLQLLTMPKPQQQSSGTPASAVERCIVQIPISAIASASATTKNDLSLALRPQASVTAVRDGGANVSLELTSVRFAIPNVCCGYEQTEEAGRQVLSETQEQMKAYQSRLFGGAGHDGENDKLLAMMAGGARKDERVIAVFDDITLSYPSGRYKLVLSNYALMLEDKKRTPTGGTSGFASSIPLADIVQLYLCDIPDSGTGEADEELAQYVVVILRNPLKIRTTTYKHLVISCPAGFALDDTHPWRCQLETQEEIDRFLASLPHNQANSNVSEGIKNEEQGKIKSTFTPTMSGRVSEILIRVLKAVTGVTALGGFNKEYQTSKGYSVLRCLHQGAHGLLYILQSALLFLHRPVTRVLLSEVVHVEVDESEVGNSTFQMVVYGKSGKRGRGAAAENKLVFSSINKLEKTGLLAYLEKKVTVKRIGLALDDDDDDDEEEEEEEEEEDDSESDDENVEEEDDDDDDDDDDESDDGKRRRKRPRSKKENKHHNQQRKKHKDK